MIRYMPNCDATVATHDAIDILREKRREVESWDPKTWDAAAILHHAEQRLQGIEPGLGIF